MIKLSDTKFVRYGPSEIAREKIKDVENSFANLIKALRAAEKYGLLEVSSGPGLGTPFNLLGKVLTLSNGNRLQRVFLNEVYKQKFSTDNVQAAFNTTVLSKARSILSLMESFNNAIFEVIPPKQRKEVDKHIKNVKSNPVVTDSIKSHMDKIEKIQEAFSDIAEVVGLETSFIQQALLNPTIVGVTEVQHDDIEYNSDSGEFALRDKNLIKKLEDIYIAISYLSKLLTSYDTYGSSRISLKPKGEGNGPAPAANGGSDNSSNPVIANGIELHNVQPKRNVFEQDPISKNIWNAKRNSAAADYSIDIIFNETPAIKRFLASPQNLVAEIINLGMLKINQTGNQSVNSEVLQILNGTSNNGSVTITTQNSLIVLKITFENNFMNSIIGSGHLFEIKKGNGNIIINASNDIILNKQIFKIADIVNNDNIRNAFVKGLKNAKEKL